MATSYKRGAARNKAITVRVPAERLKRVMRARRIANQSELINDLLAKEEERLAAEAVLRETTGTAGGDELDARLL